MNKKLTYGLGAIMASAIPIVSVISCGSDDDWSIGGLNKQISSKLADAVKDGTDMKDHNHLGTTLDIPADWKVEMMIVEGGDGLTYINKTTNWLKWVPHFENWDPATSTLQINTKTLIVVRDITTTILSNGQLTYVAEEFNEAGIKEIFSPAKAEGDKTGINFTKIEEFLLSNYSKLKL